MVSFSHSMQWLLTEPTEIEKEKKRKIESQNLEGIFPYETESNRKVVITATASQVCPICFCYLLGWSQVLVFIGFSKLKRNPWAREKELTEGKNKAKRVFENRDKEPR